MIVRDDDRIDRNQSARAETQLLCKHLRVPAAKHMDHPVMHDRIGHDLRAGIQHLFLFHRLLDLLLRDRRKFCIPFHLIPPFCSMFHLSSL